MNQLSTIETNRLQPIVHGDQATYQNGGPQMQTDQRIKMYLGQQIILADDSIVQTTDRHVIQDIHDTLHFTCNSSHRMICHLSYK